MLIRTQPLIACPHHTIGLDQDHEGWGKITAAYHTNMDVLRATTLNAGKFAWPV